MGEKKWKASCKSSEASKIEQLARNARIPRPIACYLTARGIDADAAGGFLNPRLSSLSDPYRFRDIQKAAARIWDAIYRQEPILIHGDYDTDGITGTALLGNVLRQNGAKVFPFIPHRFDDGYGFTPESLDKALASSGENCRLLVTVDCGITSCDAVAKAGSLGIDTIITDHHEPGPELPDAVAVINPKTDPALEDLNILAGAGTAFKLAHAFIKYGRENNLGGFTTRLEEVLDFVALGTVADIVPLTGENRILVRAGIGTLRRQIRPGVRALIESCRLHNEIVPSDITFKLAPRINAAGRVGDANIALRLLESENIVEAYGFAAKLEEFNHTRQMLEQEIYQEARARIAGDFDPDKNFVILVAGNNWHQGVIGIVASRLARDYNRPAVVLTIDGESAYGSGRSVGNLNLVDVLASTSGCLNRFGGHPMAVGIGLEASKIEDFKKELEKCVRDKIRLEELEEFIAYDGDAAIGEFDGAFFDSLELLGPFGHSMPKPVFRINEVEVLRSSPVGQKHLRGVFRDSRGSTMDFIAFSVDSEKFRGRFFDVLAVPQINTFGGTSRPQLSVIDIKPVY